VIDEFYGWMPLDFILRLFDRYPHQNDDWRPSSRVELIELQIDELRRLVRLQTRKLASSKKYHDKFYPQLQRMMVLVNSLETVLAKMQSVDKDRHLDTYADDDWQPLV